MTAPGHICPVCGCERPPDGSCPACMLASAGSGNGLSEAERIFQAALSYQVREREAFTVGACRGRRELLAEVRLLLEGYAEEGGDDSQPTVPGEAARARAAWAVPVEEKAGARIGHFELVRLLGQGGMGSVWEARQTEPVLRRVALKVIKLGMDTREVVSRFERERQALALMNHPNIARVFEAGATDLGRPFFVMELVEGRPITKFCHQERWGIRERLELFLELCGAIEHAHQKGVIHRDLKPSNILVTAEGGLKVIDFGVAKATREAGDPDQTKQAQVLGTPAYMSPEQASGNGVDVDTRTDVYALGVVLYEMLSGSLPFDPARLSRTGVKEMQRILREEEPQRPSTQCTPAGTVAGPPEPWQRELRGDLDWITLKCLEKDRHLRYASARALADDVECYLESRPVTAAPHRRSYYVRKWVARHRVAFAAGVAVAGSLLLGTIVSVAQARRAGQEAARATAAQAEAERLLVISQQEEGKAWLERARALQKDRNFFAAKLMAGRAVGFDGFGRAGMDRAFQERYPVLLNPLSAESAAARRLLASPGDYAMLWQSPSSAHHDGPVEAVAFSPDGTLTASCGPEENVIRVHGAEDGRLRYQLTDGAARPAALDFSPDGKWLAAGGESARVMLWDGATGQPAFALEGTERRVTQVHFSADGQWLGVSGAAGGVTLWDLTTRRPQPGFGAGKGAVMDFALSRDARRVAVLTADSFFRVYDNGAAAPRWEFPPLPRQTSYSLAMAPDGRRLYAGFALGRTLTWDLETGQALPVPFDDHRQPVNSLTVSKDGRFLASGGGKGLIRLSDAASGKEIKAWEGHPGRVLDLAFSGDGAWLASGGGDQTVRIWNAREGKARHPVTGHTAPVFSIALSPDGHTLASAGEDSTIQLWDPAAGTNRRVITGEPGEVRSLDFSPSGRVLVSVGRTGLLRFWLVADGSRLTDVKGLHPAGVNAVKFVRENLLATAGIDGTVRLYQTATGGESASHAAHRGEVLCLDAEPGGGRIATGGADRLVVLWQPGREGPQRVLAGHASAVTAVRFSPDGRTLASADRNGTLRFWDLQTGLLKNSVISSPQPLTALDYHPDGTRLAATGQDGVLRLWNVITWKLEAVLEGHLRAVHSVRFSQDGTALVSGSADHTVAVWQGRGEEMQSREAHAGPLTALHWTGDLLLTGGADGVVRRWQEALLHETAAWEQGAAAVPCIAAHGAWIITAGASGEVQVRNRRDGAVLHQFHAHRNRIDQALFSPDGRQLITTSQDGKLRVWQTGSWQLVEQRALREPGVHRSVADYSLCFSRDGTRLFCAGESDGRIRSWLTADWQETETLLAHPKQVRSLHCHPQRDLLAAASGDGTVSVWNTLTLQPVTVLEHHTGEVFDARFDPTGHWLATAGEDQTMVLWETDSWQPVDVLEGCIGAVRVLRFDATGRRLASGGDSGELKIWNLDRRDPNSWAATFQHYHNDGLRFTPQSGVTASGLAGPLTAPGFEVPPDSWLARRRPPPAPAWHFQGALQAGNWEAAAHWLGLLPDTAPERRTFAAGMAQEVRRGAASLPPARADALLVMAEALRPDDPAVRMARASLTLRQGDPVAALTKLNGPADPADPERWERLRFDILLAAKDFPAAGAALAASTAPDPSGTLLDGRYQELALARHRHLTPPGAGAVHSDLEALRGLALLEHYRRAASMRPYDETLLKQWIAQIAAWRTLVIPPLPLIAPGASWHYLDDATDPGTGWHGAIPDKDPWPAGGAPLGVSVMRKLTTLRRNLSGDPARPATMAFYFRHAFARPPLGDRENLLVTTQYDDGIILYLNGREIRRINMAPGPVTPATPASEYQNKPGSASFTIPASLLTDRNVLAAEVHQREPTSTDIFFDATLSATAATTENWLASLSPADCEAALTWCADFLPPVLADAWLPQLKFALADEPGPLPATAEPALTWLIRARIQKARARPAAMEAARTAALAALPPQPDRSLPRHRDLWQHLMELPLATW